MTDDREYLGESFEDEADFEDMEDEGGALFEDYEDDLEGDYEDDLEDEEEEEDAFFGALLGPLLSTVAPMAVRALGGLFRGNREDDGEDTDTLDELNAKTVPGLTRSNNAVAAKLASDAAKARKTSDAQALAAAAGAQLISRAPMPVKANAPALAKGTARLTKALRSSKKAAKLVNVVPEIQKRTIATLAKKAQKGKPLSAPTTIRTMAKQTKRMLTSKQKIAAAMQKNEHAANQARRAAIASAERFI